MMLKKMYPDCFIGTWEIKTCISQDNVPGKDNVQVQVKSGLEGSKFVLEDTGDVTWYPKNEEAASIPLFSCETYEVSILTTCINPAKITFIFGTYGEHIIKFQVKKNDDPYNRTLILSCEGWCTLHCSRVRGEPDYSPSEDFSLLSAVEDGFFSDMVIESSDHKQFHVHSSILSLLGTDMCWMKDPPPFSGLPEGVIGSILHWLYAECLPTAMTEELAVQVIEAVKEYPCMSKLIDVCKNYLKNMALKHQIVDLVTEMHSCVNQIIEYFNTPGECLGCHPAKLCLVVKQSIRDAGVALIKLLLFCELFTKKRTELSKEERNEIIRYARSRLPIFMSQLRRLLDSLKGTFSSLTPVQRQEVATYIVPEIEIILSTISALLFELKIALEQIIQAVAPADDTESAEETHSEGEATSSDDALGLSLRDVFRTREMSKLKNFHKKVAFMLMHLLYKKESFAAMTDSNRIRSVTLNLEQLFEELPVFVLHLEEAVEAIGGNLQWSEFKFCFQVATNKVSSILDKLDMHRDSLQEVAMRLCALVQREAFTLGLISLGILNPAAQMMGSSSEAASQSEQEKNSSQINSQTKQRGFQLSLVDALMKPPPIANSSLSKASAKLLKSERFADMVFEIPIQTPVQPSISFPKSVIEHSTHLEAIQSTSAENRSDNTNLSNEGAAASNADENGSVIMKAHRVIVAARCDWFRRALQSGMKEAIHRRIIIHDTSPLIFRKLLTYLYTGKFDTRIASAEHLIELVLLGDRYELDYLKQACEQALTRHLDKDSVFYYLNLADQYNATHLKECCINYIVSHYEVRNSEQIAELSPALQSMVFSAAPLVIDRCEWMEVEIESLLGRTNLDDGSNSECSSVEEISIDRARLNDCLARLRDVLGPDVPLDDLNRVALAADCDANRAINFYYSQIQNPEDDS